MQQEKEWVLEAQQLRKSFYTPVEVPLLKSVSLQVKRGESVAIMGRSGEGKSTLLQILGTLEPACDGSLTIAGCDVSHFNKSFIRNRHIGFVFQSFHLLEDYSAIDNVLMPARIGRRNIGKGSEAYQRGSELMEKVGMSHRINFPVKLLSGGEKQRIAIARALCNNPDLILADEPSGNLDLQNSLVIQNILLNTVRDENKALVVVTHDPELASRCTRTLYLRNGSLEA